MKVNCHVGAIRYTILVLRSRVLGVEYRDYKGLRSSAGTTILKRNGRKTLAFRVKSLGQFAYMQLLYKNAISPCSFS